VALSRISSDGSNDSVVFALNRRVVDVMDNDDLGGINANDDRRYLDIIMANIIVYIEPQKTPLCFEYVMPPCCWGNMIYDGGRQE